MIVSRPKSIRSFSLSEEAYAGLKRLAKEVNVTGPRGKSVSSLIEAIGLGTIELKDPS